MKSKLIRLAPILLIIAIAIFSIALIVTIGRSLMGGNSNNNASNSQTEASKEEIDASVKSLLSLDDGRSVRMKVRGPITAKEDSKYYIVEVSKKNRILRTFRGYDFVDVIDDVVLDNNKAAYEEFVNALNRANMMAGTAFTGEADNLLGICATGHIHEFAILKDGNVEKRLWTSTCSGSAGSLKANKDQLQNLFIAQIPNNEQIVKDLGISSSKKSGLFGF